MVWIGGQSGINSLHFYSRDVKSSYSSLLNSKTIFKIMLYSNVGGCGVLDVYIDSHVKGCTKFGTRLRRARMDKATNYITEWLHKNSVVIKELIEG